MQKNRIKKNVFSVVFDVGKSNAKILIFDKNLKIKKIIKSKYPKTKVNKNLFIKDINFLILWFKKNLYLLSKNYKIDKIVTSAHGAAFGLVDRNDKPIFGVMDYESNFDSVLKEFIKIKPSFKESLSPVSEKGLNLGKQILFLKLKKQKIFKKTKYILLLPQYISWIFSGKYSSEISYLGNHTHLWNFKKKSYSSFAKRLKIQNKFPKINSAWKTLGSYSLDQRLKDDKIKIINGIHDSDASYLLFIKSKFKKFNLISSGTQIVTMNASTSSKYLKDGKEMYGGINIFGKTVPTIRFMGGREYEFLKQKLKINKKYEKFEPSFFSKEKFLYPSYGVGGPFSKMKGNYINFIKENGNIRYMAIITYISFVLNYSMDLLKCKDSIIITGPLIHNHNILKILNSLRGKQKIYLSSNQEGTGLGASLLFDLKKKINLDFKLFNSKKIPEINSSYQHWVKKIIN